MAGVFGYAEATAASEEFLEDWRAQKAPASRAHSKRCRARPSATAYAKRLECGELAPAFCGRGSDLRPSLDAGNCLAQGVVLVYQIKTMFGEKTPHAMKRTSRTSASPASGTRGRRENRARAMLN